MAVKKTASDDKALPLVAYLCGEERLLVDDAHQRLRNRVLEEVRAVDFNHDRVSAKTTPVGRFVDMCRTLPVMSPRRLVEVRDAEAITTEEDRDALLAYVKAPDPGCTLILVGDKADMRLRVFKELNTAGVIRVFGKPSEKELPDWLHQRSARHGITLSDAATDGLVAACGAELMLLERALEKLRLVVGEGGLVDEGHVAEHVTQTRVETSFKIVDALAAGNVGEALQVLLSVVDAGEPPLRLLGALTYAQRNSIRFLDRLLAGAPLGDAAKEARIFFNASQVASRVKATGQLGLTQGLMAMADADRMLKGSAADDEAVLVQLLLRLHALRSSGRGAGLKA